MKKIVVKYSPKFFVFFFLSFLLIVSADPEEDECGFEWGEWSACEPLEGHATHHDAEDIWRFPMYHIYNNNNNEKIIYKENNNILQEQTENNNNNNNSDNNDIIDNSYNNTEYMCFKKRTFNKKKKNLLMTDKNKQKCKYKHGLQEFVPCDDCHIIPRLEKGEMLEKNSIKKKNITFAFWSLISFCCFIVLLLIFVLFYFLRRKKKNLITVYTAENNNNNRYNEGEIINNNNNNEYIHTDTAVKKNIFSSFFNLFGKKRIKKNHYIINQDTAEIDNIGNNTNSNNNNMKTIYKDSIYNNNKESNNKEKNNNEFIIHANVLGKTKDETEDEYDEIEEDLYLYYNNPNKNYILP